MSDVPPLADNLSDDEDYNEEDWKETEPMHMEVTCLFCTLKFPTVEEALKHCEVDHHFNLTSLKHKHDMDCYSYIKLINYIRTHKPDPEVIKNSNEILWDSEQYLKPVEMSENWLMFDIDSLPPKPTSGGPYPVNVENGLVTLTQEHFLELRRTLNTQQKLIYDADERFKTINEDMNIMKSTLNKFIEEAQVQKSNGEAGNNTQKTSDQHNCVANIPIEDDQGYFNTYAHFGIHYEMLADTVRTSSYQNAILSNKNVFKDKVVLDLGCGTGILSMFCATAGAKKVFALDQSDIIYHAMDIIQENCLQDIIKPVKGRLENIDLGEKVDIIVSEWMGYFLLCEGMLDSFIYARDNCLKPGGLMLPNRCNISLVANGNVEAHNKFIDFWSDVYGYKMNCMKTEVVREASVEVADSKYIISEPCIVKEINLYNCKYEMDFVSPFSLPITETGTLTSLIGYFDTFFDLPQSVEFSTGPHSQSTHWKQTIFYLKDCKDVKESETIEGTISCSRQKSDVRAITVQITMFGKTYKYVLN